MIMYTRQFSNAVRQVIKKHKARIHTRYTFGTSGSSSMFTSEGKRKISFNCLGTKKQFNLIRKDLVKLFAGTWQQNFMKYYAKRSSWDDPRGGKDEPWSWVKPIRSKSFQDLLDVTNGSNGCYLYVYYYGTHNPVCYNMSESAKQTSIPNSRKEVA